MSDVTYGEWAKKVEEAIPGCAIEERNDGELVVFSGLKLTDDEMVVPMTNADHGLPDDEQAEASA